MSLLQSIRDGDLFESRHKPRRVGWWNLLLAAGYAFGETAYFGWNLVPKSGEEVACDGIALLLLIATSNKLTTKPGAEQ